MLALLPSYKSKLFSLPVGWVGNPCCHENRTSDSMSQRRVLMLLQQKAPCQRKRRVCCSNQTLHRSNKFRDIEHRLSVASQRHVTRAPNCTSATQWSVSLFHRPALKLLVHNPKITKSNCAIFLPHYTFKMPGHYLHLPDSIREP